MRVCISGISIGLHLLACVFDVCVRVCSERVCAPRRFARTFAARRRLAVFIARGDRRY